MNSNVFSNFYRSNKSSVIISFLMCVIFTAVIIGIAHWLGFRIIQSYPINSDLPGSAIGFTDDMSRESRIVSLVERGLPAVVSIVISKDVPIVERYYQNINPFEGFGFGFQIPQYRQKGTEKKEIGGGSGFFVSASGLVITNRHVVIDEDATYTVFTSDGKKYDAKVLARDTLFDVALLQVEGSDFPFLEFGDSSRLKPGQTVVAIGNALSEFQNSVSVGVVSGLSRSITASDGFGRAEELTNVIQTDAAINPGNSGGPLLDLSGRVIGVNVAAANGSENIGFALPGDMVKSIVESVKKTGSIIRPYLGIRYIPITEELQKSNKLQSDYGVLVQRGETFADLAVIPGSPADKAGIRENDIIVSVDDQELINGNSLNALIGQQSVGDTIQLGIIRKGSKVTVTVVLEKRPQ